MAALPSKTLNEKFIEQQAISVYQELESNQSPQKAFIGALIGAMVGIAVCVALAYFNLILVWMFFFPAWLIGHLSGQIGKVYQQKLAMIPAIVATLTHLTLAFSLTVLDTMTLATVPVSCVVAFFAGKMQLNEVQLRALWRKELGRI